MGCKAGNQEAVAMYLVGVGLERGEFAGVCGTPFGGVTRVG